MDPQLWYGIGILYEKFESYEHAISSLLAVLKMSPNFYQKSEVLSRLGMIYARTNQIDNSIQNFILSLQGNTFPPKWKIDIHIKIGILYEEKKLFELAQSQYESALAQETEPNLHLTQHLALNLFHQGKYQDSLQWLYQADQIRQDDPDTQYIKARIYQEQDMLDEA